LLPDFLSWCTGLASFSFFLHADRMSERASPHIFSVFMSSLGYGYRFPFLSPALYLPLTSLFMLGPWLSFTSQSVLASRFFFTPILVLRLYMAFLLRVLMVSLDEELSLRLYRWVSHIHVHLSSLMGRCMVLSQRGVGVVIWDSDGLSKM